MSKKLLGIKSLILKLKNLLKKYSQIYDAIIFGSVVKGKFKPRDIDVAIVLKNKINEEEMEKSVPENVHLTFIPTDKLYDPIWINLIREGYSIKKDKFLHELYNIRSKVLYKYNLKKLNPVQKVQFMRGLKKILDEIDGEKLTRTVVLVPQKESENFNEFLKSWKLEFETKSFELLILG